MGRPTGPQASKIAGDDVPYFAGAIERLRYSEELRNTLLAGLEPDLVEQYFCETGSNFKPRPSFSLPWSATPEGLPPGADFLVRLNPSCQVIMNNDSVDVNFAADAGAAFRAAWSGSSRSWRMGRLFR